MKKLFAIVLVLLMAISLAACEDPLDTKPGNDDGTTTGGNMLVPGQIDFGAIMGGAGGTDVVWGKQDAATKQEIIAAGKADGVDISFGADGSMTVVDPETGDTVTQKPDGTWVIKGADGSEGQLGGNWPDNEFTKYLPKPDFPLMGTSVDGNMFTVAFSGVTVEQMKAYVEKAKAAGFTVDATTEDENYMGMQMYAYIAYNAQGYLLEVSYAMGVSGITLTKP